LGVFENILSGGARVMKYLMCNQFGVIFASLSLSLSFNNKRISIQV
jgi:hypothetical protein